MTAKKPRPTRAQVRGALAESLRRVYEHDKHLLLADVSERSVVGRLAVYLSPLVDEWDGGWSVDIEYNRKASVDDHTAAAFKYLADVLGRRVQPAYPDLIIHRRGKLGRRGGNLLVVEAKRNPKPRHRRADHAKLVAWHKELRYSYAVRLELTADQPAWAWLRPRPDQRLVEPAVRVVW